MPLSPGRAAFSHARERASRSPPVVGGFLSGVGSAPERAWLWASLALSSPASTEFQNCLVASSHRDFRFDPCAMDRPRPLSRRPSCPVCPAWRVHCVTHGRSRRAQCSVPENNRSSLAASPVRRRRDIPFPPFDVSLWFSITWMALFSSIDDLEPTSMRPA